LETPFPAGDWTIYNWQYQGYQRHPWGYGSSGQWPHQAYQAAGYGYPQQGFAGRSGSPYGQMPYWPSPFQAGGFPGPRGPSIRASPATIVTGVLLAVTGALTLALLIPDRIIWSTAVLNAVALIAFAVIDIVGCVLILVKRWRIFLILAVVWSAVRIAIWFIAILEAPLFGLTYSYFANYLFNPIANTPPNPTGVPGIFIDIIIILEILTLAFALVGALRSSWQMPFPWYPPYGGYPQPPGYGQPPSYGQPPGYAPFPGYSMPSGFGPAPPYGYGQQYRY